MTHRLIFISGWAHPTHVFDAIVAGIDRHAETTMIEGDPTAVAQQFAGDSDHACIWVGWSIGAMLALQEAAHRPERVRGLFLLAGTARFCADRGYAQGTPPARLRAMSAGLRRRPAETLADFLKLTASPHSPDAAMLDAGVSAAMDMDLDRLAEGLTFLRDTDLRRAAAGIDAPAVVIHGKEDAVVPWQAGHRLAQCMKRSEWILLDGVGHDLPIRCADRVASRLREFVDRCP